MEIIKEDAEFILHWADVAEGESQFWDKNNLIKRIKDAFPSVKIPSCLLES